MITDLSYVSLVVNNIDTAIRDFNRIYGIHEVTPITYNRPYGWLRVILGNGAEAFLELLQPVDDKLPLWRFHQKNGEAVYLYSFVVDDLAATVRHLRSRNVQFATWPEGRPERIRSVWIHPRSTTGLYIELTEHLLENTLQSFGGGAPRKDVLLTGLSYVAAAVEDIEKARELYQDILGLEITGPRNTEPTLNFERIVLGTKKRGLLELMQPNDSNSAMGKYIAKRGPGPYMVCFTTDGDMDQVVEEINKRGGSAQRDKQYGAWLHPRPNHGIFAQLSNRYLMANS